MSKEKIEREGTNVLLYLSHTFCIIIFSVNDWLIQESNMSKKKWERVLIFFFFLEWNCLCSVFKVEIMPSCSVVSNSLWPHGL